MQLPDGEVGTTARRARQSRLTDTMSLMHVSLQCIGVRILVDTAVEIARISIQPCQRQSKLIVRLVAVLRLQVTSQLHDFGERLGAARAGFRAVRTGMF